MAKLFQIFENTCGYLLLLTGICVVVLVNYGTGEAVPPYHGGTNMTCRPNLLNTGAKKVWIDDTVKLKHGTAQKFYVCTGDMNNKTLPMIRLQIWTKLSKSKFKLNLEKRVTFTDGDKRIYEFTLNPDERGPVTDKDRIGWTVEGDASPITFTYNQDYSALYYDYKDDKYPKKGDEITTFSIGLPAVFSVGVDIVQEITDQGMNYYGNDIKPRKSIHKESGSNRVSWIDTSILLGNGQLDSFVFYVADTKEPLPNLRLQIWTPSNKGKYTLKFEKQVSLPNAGQKYKVKLGNNENVFVTNEDRIGWTSEGAMVPLSYDFIFPPSSIYYRFKVGSFPLKNSEYTFEEVQMTRVFSIGVTIRKAGDISRSSTLGPGMLLAVVGLIAQSLIMHL